MDAPNTMPRYCMHGRPALLRMTRGLRLRSCCCSSPLLRRIHPLHLVNVETGWVPEPTHLEADRGVPETIHTSRFSASFLHGGASGERAFGVYASWAVVFAFLLIDINTTKLTSVLACGWDDLTGFRRISGCARTTSVSCYSRQRSVRRCWPWLDSPPGGAANNLVVSLARYRCSSLRSPLRASPSTPCT